MTVTSISANEKAVLDNMNRNGTPLVRASYGYRKDGLKWTIVPTEALRVKIVYLMAANGYSFSEIAKHLNSFSDVSESDRKWDGHRVKGTLLSERYIGDILTNKTVAKQTPEGRRIRVLNDLMEEQYYIEGHHDPLVGRPPGIKSGKWWRSVNLLDKVTFKV